MNELQETFYKIKDYITSSEIESLKIVECVNKYREYWRPKKIKVVLLAESHVFTLESHIKSKIKKNYIDFLNLTDYPENFVRFVYCLGYGENEILDDGDTQVNFKNSGTPQYWKVFFSCLNNIEKNSDFKPILKKGISDVLERLRNKIKLLENLKKNGIWLMDASIVGLNELADSSDKNNIIDICWLNYNSKLLERLDTNYKILCIGKNVDRILKKYSFYRNKRFDVIHQPQARISKEERFEDFKKCFEICNSIDD